MHRPLLASALLFLNCGAGWINVPPLRGVAQQGWLGDIESRLQPGHPYRSADAVNWAHEGTHGVNSRLRNLPGQSGVNALYCLRGHACVLREPKVTIATVARYVPADLRGGVFGLYLQQSQGDWNQQPLYILDEWVSYTNGSEVGVQLRTADAHSVLCMLEFNAYATALLLAIEAHDPNYPDKKLLAEFIGWNIGRTFAVAKMAAEVPSMYKPQQTSVSSAFLARFVRAK